MFHVHVKILQNNELIKELQAAYKKPVSGSPLDWMEHMLSCNGVARVTEV